MRAVRVSGYDGAEYLFTANFGNASHARVSITGSALVNIVTGERTPILNGGMNTTTVRISSMVHMIEHI